MSWREDPNDMSEERSLGMPLREVMNALLTRHGFARPG
jgi:hypothetical protein